VGRGQHVGWGVTVVGYDVTDIYQEQFLPSCPGGFPYCVLFKGAPVNLIPVPIAFQVRTAAGLVDVPVSQVPEAALVVPHHGPIIQAPDAAGKGFSVRWTGHEDATQDISGFLGLNTAQTVDEAVTALDNYATGAQNFVLADDAGHIAYYPHALVPRRPWAGTAPAGQPLLPWFPLPGDGSAEWGAGVAGDCAASGASQPPGGCWIASADLPQGGTAVAPAPAEGFFITANADPVGASNNTLNTFGVPFDVHGNYLSYGWDDSTAFRHARITQRIQQLTTGGGKVSAADMESIQADHVSRLGSAFHRYLEGMPAGSAPFELARTVLAGWKTGGFDCPSGLTGIDPELSPVDASALVVGNSAGCYLFHQFMRELLPAVFADDLALAGLGVSGGNAVKGMLHMLENPTTADQGFCQNVDATGNAVGDTSCAQQVATALEAAYGALAGRLGAPTGWVWGRVHTFQPVSQFSPIVSLGYSPGPFARPGGAFTVDVANPSLTATGTSFAYGSSANVRHVSVMDPAAPRVRMQLPGPEVSRPSGVTVGPDLLSDWARNVYFDYAHGDQVLGATVATQSFTTP
jgi:penicillin amidase